MNRNVVEVVHGREAIPLRAIPYVTAWAESPDSLVRILAQPARLWRKGRKYGDSRALTAFSLDSDGQPVAVPFRQWHDVAISLESLTTKMQADERAGAEGENYASWRVRAVKALPPNCFVWLDDFQSWFASTRPCYMPTEEDMEGWAKEQECSQDPLELDSILHDGMPLTRQDAELNFEVNVPGALVGKLWQGVFARQDMVLNERDGKLKRGRPPIAEARWKAMKVIVSEFIKAGLIPNETLQLPPSKDGLLNACRYIERRCTGAGRMFNSGASAISRALAAAGYCMRSGRPADGDVSVWESGMEEISAKIGAEIFCGDF